MAALELHGGLESGGLLWAGDTLDLLDTFDSEMQEWEDQLQEMQRKIEELYNEVKARREASETITNSSSLDITFIPVRSGFGQQISGYHHRSSTHLTNNPSDHQCNRGEVPSTLNKYLQQGPQPADIQWNLDVPNTNTKFEEAENRRANLEFQPSHITCKDPVPSNYLKNVTLKPRDAPPVPPRSHESSQQPDRKCLLVDRKSCSPSVLRRFGTMLQENEGKTLIEDGVVTTVILTERLANTPVCQRKFSVGRASPRVSVQKSHVDCDVVRTELEVGQELPTAVTPRHVLLNGDSIKSISASEQLSLSQSPLKAEHQQKTLEAKEHKEGFQGEDLFSDCRMVERILGTGSQNCGKTDSELRGDKRWENHNLDQLLELMERENRRSQTVTFTQQLDTKQVSRDSSSVAHSSSFSRPARPANQRRPSRWATPTPSHTIISTSCSGNPHVNNRQILSPLLPAARDRHHVIKTLNGLQ